MKAVRRYCSVTGVVLAALLQCPAAALADAAGLPNRAAAAESPVRAVYHFSEGDAQALRGMRNINNHLNADPTAQVVVVALGHGVHFLIDGAKDENGTPFDATVAGLTARGVRFRICANTMRSLGIEVSDVNPEAVVVPSGVAEIARLQTREAHAYIRP